MEGLIDDAVALNAARLVVDLAGCSGIDAAAIVARLQVQRQMICADAQLILRHPGPLVRRMLGPAHVDQVFDIEPAGQEHPLAGVLR